MRDKVKARFRIYRRSNGTFYWQDNQSGKQGTLRTKDKHVARKFLHQKNESHEQPALNLAMAKAYASAHDPRLATRTWQSVIDEMATHGIASTRERCLRTTSTKPFDTIRHKHLIANRLASLLRSLPASGPLFPGMMKLDSKERAAEFRRRCLTVGIRGVSLHSYRHSWAEQAKSLGCPQRFAQAALGHKSRAVHEAYARAAVVICPPLEAYENRPPENLVAIPMTVRRQLKLAPDDN